MARQALLLAADASEVTRLNAWLDKAFEDAGVAEEVRGRMKLSLNEAVANVILYGFEQQPDPTIEVDLEIDQASVTARLSDNGIPFDPTEWPEKPKFTSLEDAVPGGFGVQLIREAASELAYRRDGGWNRLTITCDAQRADGAPQ